MLTIKDSIISKVPVGQTDGKHPQSAWRPRVVWLVALIGVVCALALQTNKSVAQSSGYSLRFYGHGVDDIDRVKIPIDPQVPADVGATDFTIEWWMKAAAADNTPGDCGDWICGNIIFDRDIYEPGISGFGISLYNGNIWFGSGDPIVTIKAAVNVADNAWHHIAVTRIRDTGEQCIFVDGTLDVCGTAAPGDISYPDGFRNEWPNNPYLVIGAEKHDYDQIIGQDPPQYPSYNGWIDEVRLSDVIRYTSEFETPSVPFTSDGNTVALYHLDEGPVGACTGLVLDSSGASGGPSNGACNYGGADPAGPVYTTDIPFGNAPPMSPPTAEDDTFVVDENTVNGTSVGTVSASDPDVGDSLSYGITAGNTGDAFAIGNSTGEITVNDSSVLDYETTPSFDLTVVVTDTGNLTDSASITITVNDVNETPTANDDTFAVDENSANGTPVGTVSASDQDAGDGLTYAITAGNRGDAFAIGPSTGEITVNDSSMLDYETTPTFDLTVVVTDTGNLTDSASITITVTDVNDTPTDIGVDSRDVDENAPVDTVVGNLSTTDQDSADVHTYSLVDTGSCPGPDNDFFNVSAAQLRTNATFDYEATNSYTICIRTDDGDGGTYDEQFVITVNDVNDAPTDIDLDSTDVNENQPVNTAVGNLSTTDPDSGDIHTYSLVDTGPCPGPGNGSFTVDAAQLRTSVAFDYEITDTYTICLRTDDGNGGTYDEQFVITVNDANDTPTDIGLDSTDVDENQPVDTAVGNLSTTDPDSGDIHTYRLVDTGLCPGPDIGSFNVDAAQLRTGAIFDYEVTDTYTICIRTDDGDGGIYDEQFTITVNDVNEAPTDIVLDNTDVDENLPVDAVVGNLSTVDQDSTDTHTYSLVDTGACPGPGNGSFTIDAAQLRTGTTFDYEITDSYTICLRTDDGNGGTYDEQFVIAVNDVNDAPLANDDSGPGFGTDKDHAFTTASVLANDDDPDVGDAIAFDSYDASGVLGILNYSGNGIFTYDPNGQFAHLDPSDQAYETFTYVISDTAGLTATATVTITVTGQNLPPTANDDGGTGFETDEDTAFTTGDVLANDTDVETPGSLTVHTYDDSGVVGLLDYNGDGTFDYDPNEQFEHLAVGGYVEEVFSYVVTDGVLTDTATVTITVTGLNDAPVVDDDTFTADENSASGTSVGTMSASDPDTGDSLTYAITAGNTGDAFAIDGSTGEITVDNGGAIDYDTTPTFTLTVVVTDTGGMTDTATAQVTVTNRAPTAHAGGPYSGNEGSAITLDASGSSDPAGGDLTYAWDLDENGVYDDATGATISYTWTQQVTLTVGLIVTDTDGLTDTNVAQVVVHDLDPTAEFIADPLSGDEPLTVVFTDTSTSHDGITTWWWDLDGDGSPDATIPNPTFEYTATGAYTVKLTVWEGDGDSDTETKVWYIRVGNVAPSTTYLPLVRRGE
jgi:VCBS repeat-containing protein